MPSISRICHSSIRTSSCRPTSDKNFKCSESCHNHSLLSLPIRSSRKSYKKIGSCVTNFRTKQMLSKKSMNIIAITKFITSQEVKNINLFSRERLVSHLLTEKDNGLEILNAIYVIDGKIQHFYTSPMMIEKYQRCQFRQEIQWPKSKHKLHQAHLTISVARLNLWWCIMVHNFLKSLRWSKWKTC